MSDTSLIGETRHLHNQRVNFNAVLSCTGTKGVATFILAQAPGLANYIDGFAAARLVNLPLSCSVTGPAAADKALTTHVAVVPQQFVVSSRPSTILEVMSLPGVRKIDSSLYVSTEPVPLQFSPEVTDILKPATLSGTPPCIVVHWHLVGGDDKSTVYINISGTVELEGVGFRPTW